MSSAENATFFHGCLPLVFAHHWKTAQAFSCALSSCPFITKPLREMLLGWGKVCRSSSCPTRTCPCWLFHMKRSKLLLASTLRPLAQIAPIGAVKCLPFSGLFSEKEKKKRAWNQYGRGFGFVSTRCCSERKPCHAMCLVVWWGFFSHQSKTGLFNVH